jgi:hypothetical protein
MVAFQPLSNFNGQALARNHIQNREPSEPSIIRQLVSSHSPERLNHLCRLLLTSFMGGDELGRLVSLCVTCLYQIGEPNDVLSDLLG